MLSTLPIGTNFRSKKIDLKLIERLKLNVLHCRTCLRLKVDVLKGSTAQ